MKNKTLLSFTMLIILILSGCGAYTTISTSKHPNTFAKTYRRILVRAEGLSVANQLELEWTFKKEFEKKGNVEVIVDSDFFPPSQVYSLEERKKKIAQNKIEGILLVNFTGRKVIETYIPPGPTHTNVKKDGKGNVHVSSYQSPGYISRTDKDFHEITLIDTSTSQTVWLGFAGTYEGFDIQKSLADKTFQKMSKDKLVEEKSKK